jgi:hypothetical protein
MIKVSGIWENKTHKGETFFSGSFGGVRVIILKNGFKKEGSNEPDYNMYFDENKKEAPKETKPANTFED